MPSDPETEALRQRLDALVKDADAAEAKAATTRHPGGGTGRRRQGGATIFFLVLDYVRHGRRYRLRLGTRHQPPRSGNGGTKRLPIGEHHAGQYILQLCHLA
jgi:hypothetical protein